MYDQQEFDDYFGLWCLEKHSPDWPLFKSPESIKLVRDRAASYGGLISISHFIRAFESLKASGEIKKLRSPRPAIAETPELTAKEYHSLPTAVVQQRFQNDPE